MTTLKQARQIGFDLGYDFIFSTHEQEIMEGLLESDADRDEDFKLTAEDASIYADLCFDSYQQFSPWEQTANEFNKSRNPDRTWEVFNEGMDAGARQAWVDAGYDKE